MSIQSNKRAAAIASEFDNVIKNSAKTVSDLVKHTNELKLYVTFMNDNLLNNKGDVSMADRVVFRNAIAPLFPDIVSSTSVLTTMFSIYNDDLAVWQSNFDAFLADNDGVLDEALGRFPTVD